MLLNFSQQLSQRATIAPGNSTKKIQCHGYLEVFPAQHLVANGAMIKPINPVYGEHRRQDGNDDLNRPGVRPIPDGPMNCHYAPGRAKVGKAAHEKTNPDIPIRYFIAYCAVEKPQHSDSEADDFPRAPQFEKIFPVREQAHTL